MFFELFAAVLKYRIRLDAKQSKTKIWEVLALYKESEKTVNTVLNQTTFHGVHRAYYALVF